MNTFQASDTVGDLMTRCPALWRAFDDAGIDYCCQGKRTLNQVCREKGLDLEALFAMLEGCALAFEEEFAVNPTTMSLTELADHIELTHHAYLRSEFPRLNKMIEKVACAHGNEHPHLYQVRETFLILAAELSSHMTKEEQVLFPMIRWLESSLTAPAKYAGSLTDAIEEMETEHAHVDLLLEELRRLTDGYIAEERACSTCHTILHALAQLEHDLHLHIHKENNSLFPRALEMERNHGR
jgi:regulator of cell morphogenesis and NO signaling